MEQQLNEGFAALGLPSENISKLIRYAQLLLEKNKIMNLTAITKPEDVAALHFLDSLELLKYADFNGKSVVDVGTGAGFPGLPLRIVTPSIHLTLLDSLGKRITFLQEVCHDLGISDVQCIHARAEEFSVQKRESFEIAVSRAVAALPVLCELCLPLIRKGGRFLAMKSVDSDAELRSAAHAIELLGGSVSAVHDYTIPGTEVTHRVIEVLKIGITPKKYPRPFAKIKKNPL